MSKSFLKISEAYNKLGLSGGGTSWIRKSELIATGKCDTSLLTKYGNNDYVVDDDIVKTDDWETILLINGNYSYNSGTPILLNKPLIMTKSIRISGSVTWSYITWSKGNALNVYIDSDRLLISLWLLLKENDYYNVPTVRCGFYNGNFRYEDNLDNPIYAKLNNKITFNLEYDANTKLVTGKMSCNGVVFHNFSETIILDSNRISFKNYIICKHPKTSDGRCNATFDNLRIEMES